MVMPDNNIDREFYKFVEVNGKTAVRTLAFEGLVSGISYDYISLGYTGDNLTSVVYKLMEH